MPVLTVLLMSILTCSGSQFYQHQASRSMPTRNFLLLNGGYSVPASNYKVYEFLISPAFERARVRGRIAVQGSVTADIELCIFDYSNLENFINGKAASGPVCTGRVKLKEFDIMLEPGRYFLVLNNRYSVLTSKMVNAFVAIEHLEMVPRPDPDPIVDEEDNLAEVKYSSQRKMISAKNMAKEAAKCDGERADQGIIVEVDYNRTIIASFILALQDGRRIEVTIEPGRFHKTDQDWLYTLVSKNNRVKVVSFVCGNGGHLTAHEIVRIK